MMVVVQAAIFVAILVGIGLGLIFALARLTEWLGDQTYEFRQRLVRRWRERGLPRVIVWKNLGRLALVEERLYKKALKANPGMKYPIVPGTMVFADYTTTVWQILTQEKPAWRLPEGAIGTLAEAEGVLKGCLLVHKPIFVPFSSFDAVSREDQERLFPKISVEEARRRIWGKYRR